LLHSGASSTTAREIEQFVQTDSFEQLSAFHDTEQLTAPPTAEQDEAELIELAAQATLPNYTSPHAHHSHEGAKSVKDYGIRTICQRCHNLQHQSTVHDSLRPGWSNHEFLTPQRFVQLLEGVKEKKCVVLLLVDLFDLQGSILKDVREIAGDNEVIVAANKVDLLPKDASHERVISYVHQLIKSECGFTSPRTVNEVRHDRARGRLRYFDEDMEAVLPRSNVHLVSCKTGAGFDELIRNVMARARHGGGLVYVLGTANVGKSTFINQMLAKAYEGKSKRRTPAATVSSLPGTTLDMLKIALPTGVVVYDTPGILNPSQLTTKLTFEELKAVMPSKPLKPVTLRVTEGKCVCIGALAKVELVEGKPFFLTFFASPEVSGYVVLCVGDRNVADFWFLVLCRA
jgi:ribosome biogenesis GTPase A